MEVKILGTGCAKCDELTKNVETAVAQLGIAAEIKKVTDVTEIVRHGVMRTPTLVVGGRIVSVGRVLTVEEVKGFLK